MARHFHELEGLAQVLLIRLEQRTALALSHSCQWRGVDYARVRRSIVRMGALDLGDDAEFQSGRRRQRDALPRSLRAGAPSCARRRTQPSAAPDASAVRLAPPHFLGRWLRRG